MKNNLFSSKKPKIGFVALLLFFCVLWGNDAMGQKTMTWTGATDSDWATATNWSHVSTQSTATAWTLAVPVTTITLTGGTTTSDMTAGDTVTGTGIQAGTTISSITNSTTFIISLPTNAAGSSVTVTFATPKAGSVPTSADLVVINNNSVTAPIIASAAQALRLTISNAVGTTAGPILTINPTFSLTITGNASNNLVLNGGSIINNGSLVVTTTGVGFTNFPAYGINFGNPTVLPSTATEYGISGGGTLSITLSAANFNNSAAIAVTGNSGTTTTPTDNANVTYKIVLNNPTISLAASPGGTIAAIRTAGGNNANKLIIAGTGLTMGTVGTPMLKPSLISLSGGANVTVDAGTTLTQYVDAASATATITLFSSGTAFTTNLTNNGTINILGASTRSGLNFSTGVLTAGPPATTARQVFNFTNNGTFNVNMNIPSSIYASIGTTDGGGYNVDNAFRIVNRGVMSLTNNGTGTTLYASQAFNAPPLTLTNSGTLNLNGATSSGSPTFVNNPNIKASINNSGLLTSNNEIANVVFTNSSSGTVAFVNAAAGATTSALVTGTFATNNGKIQTGSAKLNNLGLIGAYGATSVIEPGGTGKGIANFNKTGSAVVLGKLVVQVDGNTTAGTDYDQIINSFSNGGFDVTGATLDVTGISGTATPVDIMVANGTGIITGPFASVVGLTAGWSVNYGAAGKVQLVYDINYVAPSIDYVWNGSASSAWTTAGNWTPSGLPDQNSAVTIAVIGTQPTISTDASIKSLTIDLGATLTVTGPNLTVKGAITNNGTMTLASNSNLVQVDNVPNSGNITVNRNSNALSRLDYTLWSSPVTNASRFLTNFSPATDLNRFYNYNETANAYNEITTPATTPFAEATGYLIRMPDNASVAPTTQTFIGIFTGVPNNGNISKPVTYGGALLGYNAIGNPYPSTIDASAFITANTANIESSLYFWRKINAATGSAYAVYNSLGSTRTASSALPNGIIQVGQGFFVKAKSASSVNFTNAMRVANNQNQLFKTKAAQKDRVWLNLTNVSGVYSQALVGYTADAIIGVDMYDAKFINDSPIALTSSINGDEYTIQGRPAFDATDVVALNFKTNAAGDYTIAIDQADGVFAAGQDVYLVDSKTGTETNLKAGSYTFAATAGVDNSRFSLKYQKTLSIDTQSFDDNSISVYASNGTLYVNSKSATINNVTVYDVQGRLIAQKVNVKSTTAVINNLRASNQVLIVRIEGEDNSVVTKKLLN